MDVYGPALPPGFKKNAEGSVSPEREEDGTATSNSSHIIGPQVPPHLAVQKEEAAKCSDSDDEDSRDVIGPVLPPGFTLNQASDEVDSDSEDSVYGPMPAENNSESVDHVIAGIEKRATDMKKKLQGVDKPVDNAAKREEWMTLPATDYKNQFGVISRCLVDSEQNSSKKRSSEEPRNSVKNEEVKEQLEKYNKTKRSESLLEIHQKNKKRKKDKESKERKPFDRDAELGVRMMDQRQVNSVLHNAKKLNSRFSAGASQYL